MNKYLLLFVMSFYFYKIDKDSFDFSSSYDFLKNFSTQKGLAWNFVEESLSLKIKDNISIQDPSLIFKEILSKYECISSKLNELFIDIAEEGTYMLCETRGLTTILEDTNGDLLYTDSAQDVFNTLLDSFQTLSEKVFKYE